MRADQAEQFAQGNHRRRCAARAPGFSARRAQIGGAAQGNAVIRVQRNQQHAESTGALRLRQTVTVEDIAHFRRAGIRGRRASLDVFFIGAPVVAPLAPPCQRIQYLPRILEVAAPQQGGALAGKAIGGIRRDGFIDNHDAPRRIYPGLGAPARATGFAGFFPLQDGGLAHRLALPRPWATQNSMPISMMSIHCKKYGRALAPESTGMIPTNLIAPGGGTGSPRGSFPAWISNCRSPECPCCAGRPRRVTPSRT